MTMRTALWSAVGFAVLMAILGVTVGPPSLIAIGALVPIALLPAAWVALLIMGVRWTLTGDKHGTLRKQPDGIERQYQAIGTDRQTGAPRTMLVRASSPREAAATAADCGIVVAEVR